MAAGVRGIGIIVQGIYTSFQVVGVSGVNPKTLRHPSNSATLVFRS